MMAMIRRLFAETTFSHFLCGHSIAGIIKSRRRTTSYGQRYGGLLDPLPHDIRSLREPDPIGQPRKAHPEDDENTHLGCCSSSRYVCQSDSFCHIPDSRTDCMRTEQRNTGFTHINSANKPAQNGLPTAAEPDIYAQLNLDDIDLFSADNISEAWFGQQLINLDWLELPQY